MVKVRIELVDYKNRRVEYTDGTVRHFEENEAEEIRARCRREYEELLAELSDGITCTIVHKEIFQ